MVITHMLGISLGHDNGTCLDGLALLLITDSHDALLHMLYDVSRAYSHYTTIHLPSSLIGGSVASIGEQGNRVL